MLGRGSSQIESEVSDSPCYRLNLSSPGSVCSLEDSVSVIIKCVMLVKFDLNLHLQFSVLFTIKN